MLAVVFAVARQYSTCGDACCGVCSGQAVQHLVVMIAVVFAVVRQYNLVVMLAVVFAVAS
jgi:hypothetical protein